MDGRTDRDTNWWTDGGTMRSMGKSPEITHPAVLLSTMTFHNGLMEGQMDKREGR